MGAVNQHRWALKILAWAEWWSEENFSSLWGQTQFLLTLTSLSMYASFCGNVVNKQDQENIQFWLYGYLCW